MQETWRWFGPQDLVTICDVAQAGATGVVSALHHKSAGLIWELDEIKERQSIISTMTDGSPSGLVWSVVESLPVSEDIKKKSGKWQEHIANYCTSLENISNAGIKVICYNFMPVLDWTRTELKWRIGTGATCLRFDIIDFAVFDLHVLKRSGAVTDFNGSLQAEAGKRFARMSKREIDILAENISSGLPGATEKFSINKIRQHIADYREISEHKLRENLITFLSKVAPVAQDLGVRLCCHPDDPPFPLLGLPRVMSTEADYQTIIEAVNIPSNGITLCTGSLGARPDNDLPGMIERLGDRVHFLHLRNVKRESQNVVGSFFESGHLIGDVDMLCVLEAALKEEKRRRDIGREDWSIPMRPDHGQDILDDIKRNSQPGYPSIGRLKGLAELRGAIAALETRV